VVVARDGRASGKYLSDAVKATLVASGRLVLDCDVTATPTVGVAIRHWNAVGGIQISASHNPSEYNGIKLFNAEGRVIPASEGAAVKEAYERRETAWVPYDRLGRVEGIEDPHAAHLDLLLNIVDVGNDRFVSCSTAIMVPEVGLVEGCWSRWGVASQCSGASPMGSSSIRPSRWRRT
jgi:phosphomannomutase